MTIRPAQKDVQAAHPGREAAAGEESEELLELARLGECRDRRSMDVDPDLTFPFSIPADAIADRASDISSAIWMAGGTVGDDDDLEAMAIAEIVREVWEVLEEFDVQDYVVSGSHPVEGGMALEIEVGSVADAVMIRMAL